MGFPCKHEFFEMMSVSLSRPAMVYGQSVFAGLFIVASLYLPKPVLSSDDNLEIPFNNTVPSDLSIPPPNNLTLSTPKLTIQCNSDLFGVAPDVADCQSALSYIPQDYEQRTWGERHTGLGSVEPLPYRVMGGMALLPLSLRWKYTDFNIHSVAPALKVIQLITHS